MTEPTNEELAGRVERATLSGMYSIPDAKREQGYLDLATQALENETHHE